MRSDHRLSTNLLGLLLLGGLLMLSGVGETPPFDRIQSLLSPSLHQPTIYVGVGLVGLATVGLSLIVMVSVISVLFRVATRGRNALSSLPDIDPLIGGMLVFVCLGAAFLGGATFAGEGLNGAGADVPYVSEAFEGSEPSAHGIVTSDQFETVPATSGSLPDYADSDGDRLPDAWERANETPGGTPLPGADPDHKDLYLQINYAAGVQPLNDTERRQIKRIWAGMPVQNPDGTAGIRVHLDDTSPRGGRIDDEVVVYDSFEREFLERYYDDAYIGDRGCTHYLVLFGQVRGRYDGLGMTPGYLSVVDGARRGSRGGYSTRVTTLTHELLHNVVGRTGTGQAHVRRGWLYGPDGEFAPSMSTPVHDALDRSGFSRSPLFEQHLCEAPVGSDA